MREGSQVVAGDDTSLDFEKAAPQRGSPLCDSGGADTGVKEGFGQVRRKGGMVAWKRKGEGGARPEIISTYHVRVVQFGFKKKWVRFLSEFIALVVSNVLRV